MAAITWLDDVDAALDALRAAVKGQGGDERDVTRIAAACVRRTDRPDYWGPALPVLLHHAAIRLRSGILMRAVLEHISK